MQIQQDPYRYVNLVLFIMAAVINNFPSKAFTGVAPVVTRVYHISQLEANLPPVLFAISYILTVLPTNYLLDKKGLKISTLLCEGLMISGLSIRLLINVNTWFFFLGTFLCSLGSCVMHVGANKFANIWFPQRQIFLVSCGCLFAVFASDALGTFISSLFIKESSSREDIFSVILWQSLAMIVINFLMVLFFRSKPKNMQNYASVATRHSYRQDFKQLLSNRNYLILMAANSFIFAALALIFAFLSWITNAYHFSPRSNGWIFLSGNLVGCVGIVSFSTLAKGVTYKKRCIIYGSGYLAALILLAIGFEAQSQALSYSFSGLVGLFCYPLLTTLVDFASQTSFPVGQATSSGTLLLGGHIICTILIVAFSFIFNGKSVARTRVLMGVIWLMTLTGLLIFLKVKQVLRRDQYEREQVTHKQSLIESESQVDYQSGLETNGQ